MCRQTSILPEKGVAALQNNFFITNLMDVLQRTPGSNAEESSILETVTAVAAGKPLSCPNHDGNVSEWTADTDWQHDCLVQAALGGQSLYIKTELHMENESLKKIFTSPHTILPAFSDPIYLSKKINLHCVYLAHIVGFSREQIHN